jgi:type 1 fimbriae regulatory protein FimB/type 1 fimbriae regulatory protein FimE
MEIFDVAPAQRLAPNGEMRNVGRATAIAGGVRRVRDREHLTLTEVEALIEAARKGRYGLRDSTLLLMLFSHGLRLTEALRLTFRHVDLDRGIIHIKRRKGGVDGDHKLRGREIRALRRLLRENKHPAGEFIFTSERGTPLSSRSAQLMIDSAARRAGLEHLNIHPHSFRHSCGYYMADRWQGLAADPGVPRSQGSAPHDTIRSAVAAAIRRLVGRLTFGFRA